MILTVYLFRTENFYRNILDPDPIYFFGIFKVGNLKCNYIFTKIFLEIIQMAEMFLDKCITLKIHIRNIFQTFIIYLNFFPFFGLTNTVINNK